MAATARRIPRKVRKVRKSGRVKKRPATKVRFARAKPDDVVAFSVVCEPSSGATLEELQHRLSLRTIKEFTPEPEVRRRVASRLWSLGFDVFDGVGPVVSAEGSVRLFTQVFDVKVIKRITKRPVPGSRRLLTETSIEVPDGVIIHAPEAVPDALLVTLAQRPVLAGPSLPPDEPGRNLHLPGDIAQLMQASAVHRQTLASGDRATGGGITVAVVDTGFPKHPYFADHHYRITRIAAQDATSPTVDAGNHGAPMLAGLFACAPDIHAIGVKQGNNPLNALEAILLRDDVNVVSLSWGFDHAGRNTLISSPFSMVPIAMTILTMIERGITVVAAAGNSGEHNFPAMMPDVIAVGGVVIDEDDSLLAYDGGSSFESLIYEGRTVPDVCGIASNVFLPIRQPGDEPDWLLIDGATSLATAQVAGVAALLLQKKPSLTPQEVRHHLMDTATDVKVGKTATKHKAQSGHDLATGAGLVHAFDALESVYP